MTSDENQPAAEDLESAQPNAVSPSSKSQQKTSTSGPRVASGSRSDKAARLLLVLLILMLGAVAVGSYRWLWPQWQTLQSALEKSQQDLELLKVQQATAATQFASGAAALDEALAQSQAQVSQWLELAGEDQQALVETNRFLAGRFERFDERLNRLAGVDRQQWLVRESQFLVRLAAQRLLISRDVAVAADLLVEADDLLREADMPRLEKARMAIAADRAALYAVPDIDGVGIYARLQALIDLSDQLGRQDMSDSSTISSADASVSQSPLQSGLSAALQKLSEFLVIKHSDEALQVSSSPSERALLVQTYRLLLTQAQMALLSADADLFRETLLRSELIASQLVFHPSTQQSPVVDEIVAIRSTDIAPALPDLLASREALAAALRDIEHGDRSTP